MSKEPLSADLIRGHIDTIILKLLLDGDRYGYDIIKEIERKSGGKYKIKQPTLYSCLKRLEEQGFTHSYWEEKEGGGRKKFYSLTQMGKEVFLKNQSNWQQSKEIIDLLIVDESEQDYSQAEKDNQLDTVHSEELQKVQYDNFKLMYENDKAEERYDNFSTNKEEDDSSKIFIPPQDNNLYEQISFERFDFTQSSYELEQNTNVLKEVSPNAQADNRQKEQDISISIESYHQNQKDKKSYLDNVSDFEYKPISKNQSTFSWNFEEELPYSEHIKKEYGEDSDEEEYYADVNELPYEERIDDTDNDAVLLSKDDVIKTPNENQSFLQFFKYDSSSLAKLNDSEIINREYHYALSKLIRPQKRKFSSDPYQQKKLEKTAESAKEMGEDVIIRQHTDTVKKYNSENYYYSNRLRLMHYAIMFLIMLLQTAISFVAFEVVIHKATITYIDRWIYIFGVALSLLLPIIAFILASKNFNKRKKLDYDFKSSFIYRLILTLLFIIIIASINAYLGIITNDFTNYLASFAYPIILITNLLISDLVFYILYKSNKFR